MKINVLIEKSKNNWAASSNDEILNGSITVTGETRDDVLANFRAALLDLSEFNTSRGIPKSNVTEMEIHELIPV